MRKQIYLDSDGVLADFDRGAEAILGLPPKAFEARRGAAAFWKQLAAADDFFANLEPLPDAFELYEAVRHKAPIILTGLPRGKWAEPQKRRWAERHFPGVPVITTLAALKHEHRHPGDVLVDDRDKHRHLWEANGGVFVHHTAAAASIAALQALGYLD
jgi:PAS domain-containing protein